MESDDISQEESLIANLAKEFIYLVMKAFFAHLDRDPIGRWNGIHHLMKTDRERFRELSTKMIKQVNIEAFPDKLEEWIKSAKVAGIDMAMFEMNIDVNLIAGEILTRVEEAAK